VTHRDTGKGQARTLLEQRIAEMHMTLEEFPEYAERLGREHKEPGTLSVRHLQRLVAGQRGDSRPLGPVRPATARLLELACPGDSITDLLAPPLPAPEPADSASGASSVLLPVVVNGRPVLVSVDADALADGWLSVRLAEQVSAAAAVPADDEDATCPVLPVMTGLPDFSGPLDVPEELATLLVADPALFGAITSGATTSGNDTHDQHNILRLVMDALKRRGLLSIFGVAAASAFVPQLLRLDSDGLEPFAEVYVTADSAHQIRLMVPELYALDAQMGGDGVCQVAEWCLRKVDLLLSRANYGEPAGCELQSAYGELAELAGWLHFDAGRYGQARFFYGEALSAAQLAEDLNLEVHTLASMNILSRYRDRPREAVQFIQLAQRRATGWASPRLAAVLASREAASWAQLGEAATSRKAMHRADHTFHPDMQQDDPTWINFFNSAELAATRATASSYLGRVDQAIAAMQSAVDGLGAKFQRNRALYSVRLGISLLDDGDQIRACEVVQPVLPLFKEVRSGRTHALLGEFLHSMRGFTGTTTRDLLEYARTLDIPHSRHMIGQVRPVRPGQGAWR
jgi:hypothetical protein